MHCGAVFMSVCISDCDNAFLYILISSIVPFRKSYCGAVSHSSAPMNVGCPVNRKIVPLTELFCPFNTPST